MKDENFENLINKITEEVLNELRASSKIGDECKATIDSCSSCGYCVTRKPIATKMIIDSGAKRIGLASGIENFDSKLASMIDHTMLKPNATAKEIDKICDEAIKYNFYGVCVNSSYIPQVARRLSGTPVKPVAVVGFPLGAASSNAKAFEAREAIRSGAQEIDMVINIGALKSKDYDTVFLDIKKVVEASKPYSVKVILETAMLTDEEKIAGSTLAKLAQAKFVKTSTGFGPGGATIKDVELMRKVVGEELGVKASGGIKTTEDAREMIKAGANRIGASASIEIVTKKK
jgi:deoxyribose-phosphate aldolase